KGKREQRALYQNYGIMSTLFRLSTTEGYIMNNIKEKLQEHQSFASVSIMHAAVEEHVKNNSLNESALRVLRVLEFRSKMVPGVCWLKYATIAEVIGKSVSTVRRAISAL